MVEVALSQEQSLPRPDCSWACGTDISEVALGWGVGMRIAENRVASRKVSWHVPDCRVQGLLEHEVKLFGGVWCADLKRIKVHISVYGVWPSIV